ncbi:Cupin domain-containing protein [Desulfofundulus thermosubterraneus DSM 16057]|uniref:Cupin domain-containing protein n=1 Tax=Desulfofundulus thermosubterraneus DSM 16057 TaxID=1121432 RepID=A0A1M6A6V9_9FIRM|nr:Cupin domain-containing protein [Desulfofundulus thermosubterraneus DSM 16057]
MKIVKKNQFCAVVDESYPLKLLISGREHGAKNCQVGIAVLKPGQRLPVSGYSRHASEEVSYILTGKVRLDTDTGSEIAEEGDLVFMPGNKPHASTNISQGEAKILWFVTPHTVPEN